jgi:uncharacterized membrane protein (DUF4010 family)
VIAALSGLTDMDAITLSTARLVQAGAENNGLSATDGWRLIVIAAMSNLTFKVGLVAVSGSRRLLGGGSAVRRPVLHRALRCE